MALIKCPECGEQISDKAQSCPHCGCPSSEFKVQKKVQDVNVEILRRKQSDDGGKIPVAETPEKDSKKSEYQQESQGIRKKELSNPYSNRYRNQPDPSEKRNKTYGFKAEIANELKLSKVSSNIIRWGIAIFMFFLAIILLAEYGSSGAWVFIFLALCGLFASPLSNKLPFYVPVSLRIIITIALFIMAGFVAPKEENDDVSSAHNEQNSIVSSSSENEEIEPSFSEVIEESVVEASTEIVYEVPSVTDAESQENIQDVTKIFFLDFIEDWRIYTNQYISISFEVGSIDEEDKEIRSIRHDYESISVFPDNFRDVGNGNYITVSGIVNPEAASPELINAHIEASGNSVKEQYLEDENNYNERKAIEAAEYEADFKENAEAVSYEDLSRYPDTYKNKRIKVNVSITDVEPDGIIFSGHYEAVISGTNKKVAIYDKREVKEPKLLDGDTATIYGYGDGLTTIKVKDTSGLIPKTVDEYTIPGINIEYVEIN